ncbi:MAG: metal ABC transporter permease [Candidatus Dormibacteria bacterium]
MLITDAAVQPQVTVDVWSDVQQLLEFPFMQNAFKAGTIVAVVAGLIGYYMVLRGQSFAGHTLSQIGFPGAAGAALVGIPPVAGLLLFCVAGACGIAALSTGGGEGRAAPAAIGSVLAFASALGFLFASLYQGFVGGVYAFLFGTFIGISDSQVIILLVAAVLAVAGLAAVARPLLFASVDPDVAAARGVPVRALSVGFLILMGLAVAESAQITGTLLVFALLVTPAATAHQLTGRPAAGAAISVMLAVAFVWLGLSVAYFTAYPVGFLVTTIAFAAYLVARLTRWGRMVAGRRPGRASTHAGAAVVGR